MEVYKNYEEIKKHLEDYLSNEKARLEAWESVEIVTKKDGTPFKVMNKNFKNANYCQESYDWYGEYRLKVYFHDYKGYKQDDDIYCYTYVEDLKPEDPRYSKKQNFQPKREFLRQIYTFDLEDVKNAIEEHKTKLKKYIEDYQRQLALLDERFDKIDSILTKLVNELTKIESEDKLSKTTYYTFRDYAKYWLK